MLPRDDDKAMEGLLRRSLARDSARAGECPGADILAAYYEHSLDTDEAASYEQHIAQCTQCREHLAATVRAETAVEVPSEPELAGTSASAPRTKVSSPASDSVVEEPKHSWVFRWRWLAPVAAVVVFAVLVYVRMYPREAKFISSKNQVAALKQEPTSPAPPMQALDAVSPAARLKAPRAGQEKPAGRGDASAPSAHPPTKVPPTPSPLYGRNYVPGAGASAGAGAGATGARTSTASRFVGGATQRSRVNAAGDAAQRQAAAGAAASEYAESNSMEQPAAAPSAKAASNAPAPASPPPPAEAKKESQVADSSAQSTQSTAANAKSKAPAAAGGLAGENTGAMTQAVTVTAAEESLAASEKIGALYRITTDGLVERSNDGGATWQAERLKSSEPIVALSAPSGKICWLVGRGGIILLTKNGKSWKKISPPAEVDLIGVAAQDDRSAIVTAIDGQKFSTADAGKTWEQLK